MNEYWYVIMYAVLVCAFVREVAKYKSSLGVEISNKARIALLIFNFEQEKISIIAVVSQIYLYIMLAFFVASRFRSLDFLLLVFSDPNTVYNWLVKIHIVGVFPIAFLEEGITALRQKIKEN